MTKKLRFSLLHNSRRPRSSRVMPSFLSRKIKRLGFLKYWRRLTKGYIRNRMPFCKLQKGSV
jgi:hypothetical protein